VCFVLCSQMSDLMLNIYSKCQTRGMFYTFKVIMSNANYYDYQKITADRIPNIDEIRYIVLPDYLEDEE